MKKTRIIFTLLIVLTCFSACEDFVEIDTPSSQLTGDIVFEDPNTANAALVDIYAKLRDEGILSGASVNLGYYADELLYYGSDTGLAFPIFNNSLLPSDIMALEFWNDSYHQIYCVNAVIEGCQNSVALSEEDKDRFMGEAYFIRGLVHFYLLNLYGNIPYITTTNYQQNRLAKPMSNAEIYKKIVTDLERAVELLPENYLDPGRVRPVKATALALLARVYLYQGEWQQAEMAASFVIDNPVYIWEQDLDKIFLKESTTTIWQFSPEVAGDNTLEAAAFIFTTGPPPVVELDPDLVAAFDHADLRKAHWVGVVTDGTNTWHHAYKYKQNTNTGTSMEYSVVLRLAEQYLIRAEARAKQGNLMGAKEDLNKIRNRAGLPNSPATSLNELIADIMVQRRLELFTEYGHRFFDLKRSGNIHNVLSVSKPGWDHQDNLWPIPEAELLTNPNMVQNPGY